MEENPLFPMESTSKIIRVSIFSFLQNFHYFISIPTLLAFPFAASILFSQSLVPSSSSLLPAIYNRLRTLFDAAEFPPSLEISTIFNLKLSQTITSSIYSLPFTTTFLLISKASIIQSLIPHKPTFPSSFSSIISLYIPLLHTYIWNLFFLLSANATAFSILFITFNSLENFGFSFPSFLLLFSTFAAIVYSLILANAFIICNLALILSAMERRGGYMAILEACVLIRERNSTAMSLALFGNLGLAAIEGLFQIRVLRHYYVEENPSSTLAFEGIFIAYLYSILVVLDTILSCMFFKSCKARYSLDEECIYSYNIKILEEEYD